MDVINAGELDKKIQIYQQTKTYDAVGQEIQTWTLFTSVFANVDAHGSFRKIKGAKFFQDGQIFQEANMIIQIRYLKGLNTTFRISHSNVIYDIIEIYDVGNNHIEHFLICKELSNIE